MFQESFIHTDFLMQSILNEPLPFSYSDEDITMLGSALSFNQQGIPGSYLNQIMENLIIYPGPTETLVKDLEILADDLTPYSL